MHNHYKFILLILVFASSLIIYGTVFKDKTLGNEHSHRWLPVYSLPSSSSSPNTAYYVWCGKRVFEFQHYLSVLSVIHHLKPDTIVFLYDDAPTIDGNSYNTWFKELSSKHAFFQSQPLQKTDFGCAAPSVPNMTFVEDLLNRRGGIYINEMTVISNLPPQYLLYDYTTALHHERTGRSHLMLAKRGYKKRIYLTENSEGGNKSVDCVNVEQFNVARVVPTCVYLTLPLNPKDIWEVDSSFGRLARTLFYGSSEVQRPVPTYDELIPNIGHVVWIGGGEMSFLFYLCIVSLVHVAEVDMVYIHGDGPPNGKYWDLLKNSSKVQCIYRDPPVNIHGSIVKERSHVSDAWRADFMVKYGGIYIDTDAVFVRPLDRQIRGYDAVGTYDWPPWSLPFPDIINLGIAIGKRGAPYWHKDSMRDFRDNDWTWNGLRQPYKIQERYPKLIYIDPRLAVICFKFLCHPTWWPDYHNETLHHKNTPPGFHLDWRKDTYAFHWTSPTPPELESHTNLLRINSTFSEIGKYILEKAGMMNYFKGIS